MTSGSERVDDVALYKAAVIRRCLARVSEVHGGDDRNLKEDPTKQDSIVLNIQRGCETSIDLAMHLVRRFQLGVPRDSRDAFRLLESAGKLPAPLSKALQNMVGFRNVAVHQYDAIDLEIVAAILRGPLQELEHFAQLAVLLTKPRAEG
jgi:uncharacterized protein YutE (UPF0331/DUF86 family)